MANGTRRVDVGFQGGQVLALRLSDDEHEKLKKALGDERSPRWHEVTAADSQVAIDLAQVVYVRHDTEAQKVGF
jgi:hypothetical protein